MNYELAKELKDAGFPQEEEFGTFIPDPNCTRGDCGHNEKCAVYEPTLSELIQACEQEFEGLQQGVLKPIRWYAKSTRNEDEILEGETPDEAVARLWLALNKKV